MSAAALRIPLRGTEETNRTVTCEAPFWFLFTGRGGYNPIEWENLQIKCGLNVVPYDKSALNYTVSTTHWVATDELFVALTKYVNNTSFFLVNGTFAKAITSVSEFEDALKHVMFSGVPMVHIQAGSKHIHGTPDFTKPLSFD